MDMTPDNLKLVFQNVRTYYDEGVAKVSTPLMDNLVNVVPMITKEILLAYQDRLPRFRKWTGPREVLNAVIENYKMAAEKFELTTGISREHIEDDQIGLYAQRFARMGQASAKWAELLVRDRLQAGKSEICFDGKNFFATDHLINFGKKSGAQANLFPAKPLNRPNFVAVWQAMAALKGADNEPLDDFGDEVYLVHEASNTDMAKQICNAPIAILDGTTASTFGAGTNTSAGMAKPLLVKSLGGEVGTWYLIDVSGEKPLLFGARYMPDLVPRVSPDDPRVFDLDEFLAGSRARGRAGLGVWWKCARVEPS